MSMIEATFNVGEAIRKKKQSKQCQRQQNILKERMHHWGREKRERQTEYR